MTPTAVNKRTIERVSEDEFLITDHFEFEGKPATQEKTVYSSPSCGAYCDYVAQEVGGDYYYVGASKINVGGRDYYYPKFAMDGDDY